MFFLSLILILNVLEEIKFFKNLDNNFFLPIFLTLLNSSSILFEIFPFIFLIGTMNFFIEILDKNELVIYKSVGLPNIKILGTIIGATFLAGIFLVVIFYNISSNLKRPNLSLINVTEKFCKTHRLTYVIKQIFRLNF